MDRRKRDGIDYVHNAEDLPWPFPDNHFDRIIMSHIMEHLNPAFVVDIMNEMWRISKPGCILLIAMPYANSFGFWQDPTHRHAWNQATPTYFDPDKPLYQVYKPKPWKITNNVWKEEGNLEVSFKKIEERKINETAKKV